MVEAEWRRFEAVAECTPFQSFAWLSAWQRHVGLRGGMKPAIAVGRYADGRTAIIMPLAVVSGRAVARLRWLGQELCDYNAPLLAGGHGHGAFCPPQKGYLLAPRSR